MKNEADMVLELLQAISLHLRTVPREPTRLAPTTEAAYEAVGHQPAVLRHYSRTSTGRSNPGRSSPRNWRDDR